MTPEQKAAYVNAQAALLNAEIAAMVADNMCSQSSGTNVLYDHGSFQAVIDEYKGVLNHNYLIGFFHGL